ncbi:hypothetical protein GA0111570_111101 [Raineyella antarctica]|uniref:Phosphotyrosine protein phosphatase I domain-containing protein n=1 Tax=Raineyella antarctica TaxID=1577474 RepID=A0A1G6HN79_9ACTN|nr:hypothetical protein GA0111570_111101 [Raineyella antarctica]
MTQQVGVPMEVVFLCLGNICRSRWPSGWTGRV